MKTFYFKDNIGDVLKVYNFNGTPKQFENKFYKFSKEFINKEDYDYSVFYKELSESLDCEVSYITIEFNQN